MVNKNLKAEYSYHLRKYAVLIFSALLIENLMSYYLHFDAYQDLSDSSALGIALQHQSTINLAINYAANLIIATIALVDMRRRQSKFYLIPAAILFNKIVGVSLLLLFFLYLKSKPGSDIVKNKAA